MMQYKLSRSIYAGRCRQCDGGLQNPAKTDKEKRDTFIARLKKMLTVETKAWSIASLEALIFAVTTAMQVS
jgi:hypothetical protein